MVRFLKELHTALPFGPATSLLGAYPKGLKGGIQRGIGAPTFPAASFAVGGMWEQPKCPSTGELMNLEDITPSEISQPKEGKHL